MTASRAPASQATSSRIAGRHHLGISGRLRRNLQSSSRYGSNPASEVIAEPRNCSSRRRSKSSLSAPLLASPVGSPITAPVNPPQDTEFYIRIVSSALKIATSSGECGPLSESKEAICPKLSITRPRESSSFVILLLIMRRGVGVVTADLAGNAPLRGLDRFRGTCVRPSYTCRPDRAGKSNRVKPTTRRMACRY